MRRRSPKLNDYLRRICCVRTKLMNLTAIKDPVDAWEKHVLDAMTLVPSGSRILSTLPRR
jgi:16S rRNA G527 N7-methylase RsmG